MWLLPRERRRRPHDTHLVPAKGPRGLAADAQAHDPYERPEFAPDQAREIVRYLSDHHGLAPDEARPYFYRAEKRPQLENIEAGELKETCVRCHIGARFFTQRRTEEEWDLLKGMHIGYFPVIEFQTFRSASPLAGDAPAENAGSEWRADRVLKTLKADYPLETPEWKRYRAKGTGRGIAGRWLLKTHQPGEGPASGVVTFAKAGDDYTYSAEILLADGSRHQREGKGVLYGGYSWRGSSNGDGLGELREVLMLSDDGSKLEGRIFSGTYGELGLDATLVRLGGRSANCRRLASLGEGGRGNGFGHDHGRELHGRHPHRRSRFSARACP